MAIFRRKKEEVKKKIIPPTSVPGIVSVDVGSGSQARVGGYTKSGGKVTRVDNLTAEQVAQAERQREANRLANEAKIKRETELASQKAEAERIRIENLKRALIRQGAQTRQQTLRDARTQQRIRNEVIINPRTNERVTIRTNLDTGEVSTRTFQRQEGSNRIVETGGVTEFNQTASESLKIRAELTSLGLRPFLRDGQVVSFRDKEGRIYAYTKEGIDEYNKTISQQTKKLGFITGLAVKGDKTIGNKLNFAKNVSSRIIKNLESRGLDLSTIKKSNGYLKKVYEQLKSKGINTAKKLESWSSEQRRKSREDLNSLTVGQRNLISNLMKAYWRSPGVSDKEILNQFKKEFSPKQYKDSLKAVKTLKDFVVATSINTAVNLGIATPQLINQFRRSPLVTMASLPPVIYEGFKQDFKTVTRGDAISKGELVVEYYTLGKIFRITGKITGSVERSILELAPGTKKLKNGKIILRNAPEEVLEVYGKKRFLAERVKKPSIKRPFSSVADFLKGRKPGQFKRFTKNPELILKEQTVSSGAKPLSAQARLAGKEVTAVNASAQQLTSWLKTRKIIRKPIMGGRTYLEDYKLILAKDPKVGRDIVRILKRFDNGLKVSNRDFAKINKWLQKNVAPNITLLERSLYLDPEGGLRLSRLGIQPEKTATLRDILKGNFKLFGSNKPQILVFENARVAKFPKYLKDIERKLKAGKTLTVNETNKLIRWQVETGSGKFKPIGSTIFQGGKELEITLAPGEFIKRIKQIGRVYIKGKKVTIVSAEIYKPSKNILTQIKLANLGKLTKDKLSKLERFLSKELGRKIEIETPSSFKRIVRAGRRIDPNVPVLRVSGGGLIVLSRALKTPRNIPRRSPLRKKVTLRPRASPKKSNRPNLRSKVRKPPIKRAPRTTRKQKPIKRSITRIIPRRNEPPKKSTPPSLRIVNQFKPKILSRSVPSYYVVEKVRGRFKKLFPKPLTLSDAKDFAVFQIDNRFSKTAFWIPIGKTRRVVVPPKNIQGYFNKNSRKVRPYRIRMGKKNQLVNGFIELRKYAFDKPGERLRKANPSKRRITKSQREVMLRNLRKARRVRMKNLNKKK